MILYRHGIPLINNCAICAEVPMDITQELLHYSVCIKKWDGKLKEALAKEDLDEAHFYARAVGNEYHHLSILLNEESLRRAIATKSPG